MKKIYAIDLDHTLCIPDETRKDSLGKYGNAKPIQHVIDMVNELYDQGNEIVIYTARRMLTHNGDVELVKQDVGELTKTWLLEHGVKFDRIVFGKIFYDEIWDDKSVNPLNF